MIIYSFSVIFTTRRPSSGCTLVRRRHVDLLRINGGLCRPWHRGHSRRRRHRPGPPPPTPILVTCLCSRYA